MIILKFISKIIKLLESAASPAQLAWGFVLGMFLGFIPGFSLFKILIILLIILLNVNITMAIVSFALCGLLGYLLDGLFHSIGYWVLVQIAFLQKLWTGVYNAPILPYTRFNNTVVMGGLICAILLIVPVFFLIKELVLVYRNKLSVRVKKFKIVKVLSSSKLVGLYKKIKVVGG
ncbi:MAG: TIGR03546 family protein [Candidatus Cloacimonetes bacterium]|nr:TIGR03546 family protein [Candidatus Cloacimonadota bacterium]